MNNDETPYKVVDLIGGQEETEQKLATMNGYAKMQAEFRASKVLKGLDPLAVGIAHRGL